jgi:hypothetical protein
MNKPLSRKISIKQLYGLAYQWIDDKQQHGMDEAEANKLAPVILDFFEFVMKQKEKAKKVSVKKINSNRHFQYLL